MVGKKVGVIFSDSEDIPIDKVSSTSKEWNIIGRSLNFGDIKIASSATADTEIWWFEADDPDEKNTTLQQIMDEERQKKYVNPNQKHSPQHTKSEDDPRETENGPRDPENHPRETEVDSRDNEGRKKYVKQEYKREPGKSPQSSQKEDEEESFADEVLDDLTPPDEETE
ncbi:MAG: hypothetical protein ABEK59_03365 [Halobacteria archaeon]